MTVVKFTGWREGFEKIPFERHLRSTAGMSLGEAHALVNALLDGECPEIAIEDVADTFAQKSRELGVECIVLAESTTDA